MEETPNKYQWKHSYTLLLIANAAYILAFYLLTQRFS